MIRRPILIAGYAIGVLGLFYMGAPGYAFAVGVALTLVAFVEPILGYAIALFPDQESNEAAVADDLRRRLHNVDRV